MTLSISEALPGPTRRVADPLRPRAAAAIDRLIKWEYWPAWAVYLPLVPYIVLLGLRHGGLRRCTACNPSIPLGGIVGESKWGILAQLPEEWTVPTFPIRPGGVHRLNGVMAEISRRGWTWPVILKPDAGERGTGVELIHGRTDAAGYLSTHVGPAVAQAYHPGPHEAGVFYIRMPSERRGFIFSITDKRLPTVVGDGRSTIRELIWRHSRHRAQARVHLRRLGHEADGIPGPGEQVQLGFAGNHCRGTMFLDGAHLITPALTAAFDGIAAHAPYLCFGRYDVRYTDPNEFTSGRGFRIVEFNGLTSESTNIYDPACSFLRAQRILREQWRWAFAVGTAQTELARGRHNARAVAPAAHHQHAYEHCQDC